MSLKKILVLMTMSLFFTSCLSAEVLNEKFDWSGSFYPTANSKSSTPGKYFAASVGPFLGNVSPVSEVLNAVSSQKNQFSSGDLNLSQGGVELAEEDLHLPGRNGLDLSISRSYNSLKYRSNGTLYPFNGDQWSGYSNHGWELNVGMRAYFAEIDVDGYSTFKQVAIDRGGAVELFELDPQSKKYKSKTPGSSDYVEKVTDSGIAFGVSGIILHTSSGQTIKFSGSLFVTYVSPSSQMNGFRNCFVRGFNVSEISDLYNNKLTFTYSGYQQPYTGENIFSKLAVVFGSSLEQSFVNIAQSYYPFSATAGFGGVASRLTKITDTYGHNVVFSYGGSGNANSSLQNDLITNIGYKNTNGVTVNIKYSYDINGNLTSVQTNNLPAINYSYTFMSLGSPYEDGYVLTRKVDSFGGKVDYSYVISGQMDERDNIKDYRHFPVVNKKTVYEPSSSGETQDVFNIVYSLNIYNQPKQVAYSPVWDTSKTLYYFNNVTLDNPSVLQDETYIFDQSMLVKKTQGIFSTETSWDYSNNSPTQTTNKKNNSIQSITKYEYDSYANPTKIITQKGTSDYLIQEMTYYTDSTYVSPNNMIHLLKTSKLYPAATPGVSRSYFYTYNPQGKAFQTFKGLNSSGIKILEQTYTSKGALSSVSKFPANGNVILETFTYDESFPNQIIITSVLNRKSAQTKIETWTGKTKQNTDINGNVTNYLYDDYGRLTHVNYPDGSQDTVTYSSDLKTTTSTSGGIANTQTVDSLGRAILSQLTGQEEVKTEYYFSNLPSKVYKKQNGVWVLKSSILYDQYLRKTQSISPDFGTSTIAYDTPAMNQITSTDPLGRQSIQILDELGRKIQSIDTGGGITQISYNGFGETSQTIDPRNLIHKTDTDDYGRPIKVYFTKNQATGGALSLRSQTTYNTNNPSIIDSVQIFAKNNSTTPYRTYSYQYDSEGRVIQSLLNGQVQETLTYDETSHSNAKGKLVKAETPDSVTSYDFDSMGRITKETTTAKAINKTWDIQYIYNLNGQAISLRYPDGKLVEYGYDTNQRLSQIKYNGNVIITYTYNTNGTIASMGYGNGRNINYSYQKDTLLSNIDYNNGQYNQSYTFDSVGKITQSQHNDYISGGSSLTRTYSYTNKDEIKSVDLNGARQYTQDFDANSNLTRFETRNNRAFTGTNLTQPSQNMILDTDSDQLLQKHQKDGSKITVTYDPEGNMVSKQYILSDGTTVWTNRQYGYNYQGQLTVASENGQILARYGYDHKLQRIYSKTNGVDYPEKFYYWDQSGRIIGEGVVGKTDFSVRYIYNGNQKVAMERKDLISGQVQFFYFVNNSQGTPVLIVDQNSTAISKINLDEYGNPGLMVGPSTEINFTGKKMDLRTGLYYFNQRFYDPELGRFMQEDPAGQSFNPYVYCGNNPLIYVDPDGRFWWVVAGAVVGAVIANWGKPVTLENTFKGAILGAMAGALLGAAAGLDSIVVDWGFEVGVGKATIGIGGTLGTLGNGAANNKPLNLSSGKPTQGSALVPGINTNISNFETKTKLTDWKNRLGANDLKSNYNGTGILDGVAEVLLNDMNIATPKNRLNELTGEWDTLNGYSGGGHSVRMAILSGRADANTINVFGSGLTNYEDIANGGRAVNVYLSLQDPVSWFYGSYGPTGPRILILPNGLVNKVNYIMRPGIGHGDWPTTP